MKKTLYCLAVVCMLFSQKGIALDETVMTSRFITHKDPTVFRVADMPLPNHWWSRPYEYAWAALFVKANQTVLDAACGISHPFKWLLGQICLKTWATDIDHRIGKSDLILKETLDDLGKEAHAALLKNKSLLNLVNLSHSSICNFPKEMPQFDRIFCISSLEHMKKEDQKKAILEFADHLKPDGLVVLTVDYPVITPESLIEMAQDVGLVPAGPVEKGQPKPDTITNWGLRIYRCVLKHATSKP